MKRRLGCGQGCGLTGHHTDIDTCFAALHDEIDRHKQSTKQRKEAMKRKSTKKSTNDENVLDLSHALQQAELAVWYLRAVVRHTHKAEASLCNASTNLEGSIERIRSILVRLNVKHAATSAKYRLAK